MFLRSFVWLSLLSGLASAQPGPWNRFFNHQPVTVTQGTKMAMSNALSAALDPLGVTPKQQPYLPELLMSNAAPRVTVIKTCSIPLAESPAPRQFFLSRQTSGFSTADPGMIRAVPAPPCKP